MRTAGLAAAMACARGPDATIILVMQPEELKSLVRQAFPDAELELKDLTGTRDHYELHVASSAFEGLTPVKQHRLVYAALQGHVGQAIHALALKTYTPSAWEQRELA